MARDFTPSSRTTPENGSGNSMDWSQLVSLSYIRSTSNDNSCSSRHLCDAKTPINSSVGPTGQRTRSWGPEAV